MTLDHAPLTLALAMLAGVVAQAAARHLRVPGIVLLLGLGVALGPDGGDWIRPHVLGEALPGFVGFAVAIILFEGALNVRIAALRRGARSIRRLVTLGAVVTGALATLAAGLLMPWDWRLAALFGTLVMVTGPTVVNPLVRRLRLVPHLSDILIAEGIFVDAVGATVAVVALEVVVADTNRAAAAEAVTIVLRFGVGALVGAGAGLLLVGLLRVRRIVPHGLENVLALAVAIAAFHVGDAVVSESGLTAAIVAGLLVGNLPIRRLGQIAEFKEQLTDLLVATLFVLLAADVRLSDVADLGWRGAALVAVLMLVIRPASVFASTHGSALTRNEKLCLSWIAPRGIVAAAVASLFASELAHEGIAGGAELRAMVFVVIATTVTIQGLTAGAVANRLGVRLPPRSGALVLGANPLARLVARALVDRGERVTLVDSRHELCEAARAEGLDVVNGDGLSPRCLLEARIDAVQWCIGLTPNEHVNLLFARLVADELRGPDLAILLERHDRGVTAEMADEHDVAVLFAAEVNVLHWLENLQRDGVELQRWRFQRGDAAFAFAEIPLDDVLPIAVKREGEVIPITPRLAVRDRDEISIGVARDRRDEVTAWLTARGWTRIDDPSSV
jgi:NhaP-type Na+/H+ or K+/H+ antiporter/Trk K+ transport system NAD-binding subunit